MVAIIDFCWNAFLTKSALFLNLPPLEKNSGAPDCAGPQVVKLAKQFTYENEGREDDPMFC